MDAARVRGALLDFGRPYIYLLGSGDLVAADGDITLGRLTNSPGIYVPALRPEQLGDRSFLADHGVAYPYVTGAMANGIASEALVEAVSAHGMLGFFGAAGLDVARVERAIDTLAASQLARVYGFNLIHSPADPRLESQIVDLYLRRGIQLIEASAFLGLTLPLVRYRVTGIHRNAAGAIVTPNRVIAKASRTEVAAKFFAPPPEAMLNELVRTGAISAQQAQWARQIPVAQDVSAEADSGGHTDNRPALTLVPTLIALRDAMQHQHGYDVPLRVGAAGGIATPEAVAAAFAMGAAYVMTGSINQSAIESGSSNIVRRMLAEASETDVAMAPAADMFEMGVKVQVLKRGTMFPMRATKLYELYRAHASLEALPAADRDILEKQYFRKSLAAAWQDTCAFFLERDPEQIARGERDPRHKMALVFRAYLGQSSKWANSGIQDRKMDFQVWCGPAMGAFNHWVKGSHLESPDQRTVAGIAMNLLYGACLLMRSSHLRHAGVAVDAAVAKWQPLPLSSLQTLVGREPPRNSLATALIPHHVSPSVGAEFV